MKNIKSGFKWLFLFISLFSLFSCKMIYNLHSYPEAVNGVLDVSEYNLKEIKYMRLDGEWIFYPDRLVFPKEFLYYPDRYEKMIMPVPKSWHNHLDNFKSGYGTYRLKIKTNAREPDLALYFHYIYTAYVVYINGKEVARSGRVSSIKQYAKPEFVAQYRNFTDNSGEIDIIIQVSNYHQRKTGIISPVLFGTYENIKKLRERNLFIDTSIFSSFFLLNFYFLFIFTMRKKETYFLFFSLICIFMSVKILVVSEVIIKQLIPVLHWALVIKSEYAINVLAAIFLNFFIYSLYRNLYPKILGSILVVTAVIIFLIIIILPTSILSSLVFPFYVVFFVFCLFSIYILIKEIHKKQLETVFFFIGFLIFLVTAINDLLYSYELIQTGEYSTYGLYFFILFLGFLFSSRFTNAFNTAEYLSENLKEEVEIKTKELRTANEKQKNFFINLAHETKTPLTLISNYLNSYIKETGTSEKLQIIKLNIEKLKKDMVNLLDFEKLEQNHFFYDHNILINFSEILTSGIPLFVENAGNKDQKIEYNIEDNLFIYCDPSAIDRIVNNIVENAIRYTFSSGVIKINLYETDDSEIMFEVIDNGIGISKEQQSNIFNPYYQISHKKRNLQGIGLGLNIVNNIVKQLDGEIIIDSTLGKGTKFTIKLKKAKPAKTSESSGINKSQTALITDNFFLNPNKIDQKEFDINKKTIIVVEDNIDMLMFLQTELSDHYNIFTAINGKDAVQKLSYINKPDLIISDIMMDVMDGYEFLNKITENDKLNGIPFIFLTAKSSDTDKISALNKGAIDFIQKPFLIEELKAKIKSILHFQSKQSNRFLDNVINILKDNFSINDDHRSEYENKKRLYDKYKISPREVQIIILLSAGLEYKEIASKLNISTKTVGNHIQNIYKKINVNNKVELINFFS